MSAEPAITVEQLNKTYALYHRPIDRLKQMLWGEKRQFFREFVALKNVSFTLKKGEVLGLIGKNGAGKSTLLQLICGTLTPTHGSLSVNGRIAALLELGAGFNPEFTGHENIYLNAAVLGLSPEEITARYADIVEFSGIADFIHQPVKNYSSGMYVRLAFAIATSVDPDILVIDEALSVGDGEFARKSFDRIMQLKERGATILFCSHSMFHIEALCTQALWLHQGEVVAQGNPAHVVNAYQSFLDTQNTTHTTSSLSQTSHAPKGRARFTQIRVNGHICPHTPAITLESQRDDLIIEANFTSDPELPAPSLAFALLTSDQRYLTSAGNWHDLVPLERTPEGQGYARLTFPKLSLLKGRYLVSVHLLCERGLHVYESAERIATLELTQNSLEQGVVHLPHHWHTQADSPLPPIPCPIAPPVSERKLPVNALTHLMSIAPHLTVGECLTPEQDALFSTENESLLERFGLTRNPDGFWQKQRAPRWRLGWCTEADLADWHTLFHAAFGYEMSPEYRAWKYSGANPIGVAAWKDDTMIAFYGGMPREALFETHPMRVLQIGDVMVHPSERGVLTRRGPFQQIAATYQELQGGQERPCLLGFGFPEVKAMQLPERYGIYAPVDRITELSWDSGHGLRFGLIHRAVPLQDTNAHDALINQLWQDMAADFTTSIIGVRNADFVRYRFKQHPMRPYQLWLVQHRLSGRALGVMILRDREATGLEIIDFVAPLANFPALLSAARRHASRLGRSRVFMWITASHANRIAIQNAQNHLLEIAIPTNTWRTEFSLDRIQNKWWLTGGDTDFR